MILVTGEGKNEEWVDPNRNKHIYQNNAIISN
jgi:hypothetical protein